MAESTKVITTKGTVYKSEFPHRTLQKFILSMAPDVHFIFQEGGETIKLPAHKILLAASSPVFDAMFNGELKEKGDVKIVDASSAAFKEFLQFFYNDEVKLTMENIADVLNLAHKYDITEASSVAIKFLKENLPIEKTMWCLKMAVKYELDELKAFCKGNIATDPMNALNGSVENDELYLVKCENPAKKQRKSLTDSQQILAELMSISKEIISKQLAELKQLKDVRSKHVIPYILPGGGIFNQKTMSSPETLEIRRSRDGKNCYSTIWLSEIVFTEVYTGHNTIATNLAQTIPLKGGLIIQKKNSFGMLCATDFTMSSDKNYIKLPKPILIETDATYVIKITPSVSGFARKLLPNAVANEYGLSHSSVDGCTLIQRLHFEIAISE